MELLFLDTYYIDGEHSPISLYLISKDFLVPILTIGATIFGALWVAKRQIKNQREETVRLQLEDDDLYRRVFILNVSSTSISLKGLVENLSGIISKLEDVDFDAVISDMFLSHVMVIEQLDYHRVYRSFRSAFNSVVEFQPRFFLCYNALYSLKMSIDDINQFTTQNRKEYVQYDEQISIASTEIVPLIRQVLLDDQVAENLKTNIQSLLDKRNQELISDEAGKNEIKSYHRLMAGLYDIDELHSTSRQSVLNVLAHIRRSIHLIQKLSDANSYLIAKIKTLFVQIHGEDDKLKKFLESYREYSDILKKSNDKK